MPGVICPGLIRCGCVSWRGWPNWTSAAEFGVHWNAVLLKLGLLRNAGASDVRPRNGGRGNVFMFVGDQREERRG